MRRIVQKAFVVLIVLLLMSTAFGAGLAAGRVDVLADLMAVPAGQQTEF